MASLRTQQAGRDAASFDDDRKEGRYAPGHFASEARAIEPASPEVQAACDAALAQVERAFGKFDRTTGTYDWSTSAPAMRAKAHRVAA